LGRHTVLGERYELLSPLGRGGMGQVWEGEDRRLRRPVAVKLLTEDALAGHTRPEELARRFAREASVTAGLRHPGVPAVYDAGTYDGGLFLVLELIAGRTLGDLMAEEGPLPIPWATGIATQVAAVLAAAHDSGLIHRDVKPQNIMLTGDGAIKVLDFGVAALVDQTTTSQITRTGQSIGTPAYMAPEQLRGRPATARTDLYALGCVLYEMLSGDRVFTAASPAELMHLQLEQAPAPLHRDDLPPDLDALVRQLLDKEPARRPASARETYDRLLPHVVAPGPLGDIDPAGERQGGGHLYSRALVRLTGPADAPSAQHHVPPPRPTLADQPMGHWPMVPAQSAHGAPPMTAARSQGGAPPVGHPSGPSDPSPAWGLGGPPPAQGPRSANGWTAPMPTGLPTMERPPTFGWKLLHSLWMLPALLFGAGTWLSFAYIAARHRRPAWLLVAAVYLVAEVVAFALVGIAPENEDTIGSTCGVIVLLLGWPAGIIHATWVNPTHLRLRAQQDRPA
jgi:Protein kinase domain